MWILATSSSLADADLPWISPIAIAVAVLLIITAAYFVVKAHIDKKLTKEREAMIRSQQEQELKTAQNKIRFLTNVSQQLFTPLTLIYAPVNELLRRTRDSRDPVPTHDAYCLSEIERNSLRLIRLIEQQLDYEKLDQGQLTLQIGPSDIIPRIRNVIKRVQSYIGREKHRYTSGLPVRLAGPAGRFRQTGEDSSQPDRTYAEKHPPQRNGLDRAQGNGRARLYLRTRGNPRQIPSNQCNRQRKPVVRRKFEPFVRALSPGRQRGDTKRVRNRLTLCKKID